MWKRVLLRGIIGLFVINVSLTYGGNGMSEQECIDNPCTQWDAKQHDCSDLPEGTSVPGEPCKECDGSGNVRDKSRGDSCSGGRCCGGNCISVPLTPCPLNGLREDPAEHEEQLNIRECGASFVVRDPFGNQRGFGRNCTEGDIITDTSFRLVGGTEQAPATSCGVDCPVSESGGGGASLSWSIGILQLSYSIPTVSFSQVVRTPGPCKKLKVKYCRQATRIKASHWCVDLYEETCSSSPSGWCVVSSTPNNGLKDSGWVESSVKLDYCSYDCAP
jgi:hypothetical protein